MNKTILLFLIITALCSCNSTSNEIEPIKSKTELDYEMADLYLEYDAKKIGLLSIIENVPHDKANSILRDYLAKTLSVSEVALENPDYIVKVVDTVAQKNGLSKKLTASIIFSYQYEMITRDEIIEEKMEELEKEYLEEQEPY